ncbi:hypothetical protein VTK56DRAFT_3339 [Thermocarpiscus australiensis]
MALAATDHRVAPSCIVHWQTWAARRSQCLVQIMFTSNCVPLGRCWPDCSSLMFAARSSRCCVAAPGPATLWPCAGFALLSCCPVKSQLKKTLQIHQATKRGRGLQHPTRSSLTARKDEMQFAGPTIGAQPTLQLPIGSCLFWSCLGFAVDVVRETDRGELSSWRRPDV